MKFSFILKLSAAVLVVSMLGCSSFLDQFAKSFGNLVVIPQSDTTPPSVKLIVPDRGSGQVTITTNSGNNISIKKDETFFVVAEAEDPEGIQELRISRTTSTTCRNNGEASTGAPLSSQIVDSVNLNPGDKALTKRWIPTEVAAYGYCDPQSDYETRLVIVVTAKNFSGLSGNEVVAAFKYP